MLVVHCALVVISKDLVRAGDGLELCLCLFPVFSIYLVGMVLESGLWAEC